MINEPTLRKQVSLKPYNSFGIEAKAFLFIEATKPDDIFWALERFGPEGIFLLGGGSNVLFTKDEEATVIHIALKGIHELRHDGDHIFLRVMAGEDWPALVEYTVSRNWGGLENLSLIPGQAGTAPVQNIGAYGAEVKDCIEELEYIDLESRQLRKVKAGECGFGYRDSIFKNELKDRAAIVSVTFRLSLAPKANLEYRALNDYFVQNGKSDPGVQEVALAVINIRQSKLPDPAQIGNAGSFFKNPLVSKAISVALQELNPDMPAFVVDEDHVKIPAAWLIEKAGWKGYRRGDAGVHSRQALVLVNHGKASGMEILQLSRDIQADVSNKFGVELRPEVNIR